MDLSTFLLNIFLLLLEKIGTKNKPTKKTAQKSIDKEFMDSEIKKKNRNRKENATKNVTTKPKQKHEHTQSTFNVSILKDALSFV